MLYKYRYDHYSLYIYIYISIRSVYQFSGCCTGSAVMLYKYRYDHYPLSIYISIRSIYQFLGCCTGSAVMLYKYRYDHYSLYIYFNTFYLTIFGLMHWLCSYVVWIQIRSLLSLYIFQYVLSNNFRVDALALRLCCINTDAIITLSIYSNTFYLPIFGLMHWLCGYVV